MTWIQLYRELKMLFLLQICGAFLHNLCKRAYMFPTFILGNPLCAKCHYDFNISIESSLLSPFIFSHPSSRCLSSLRSANGSSTQKTTCAKCEMPVIHNIHDNILLNILEISWITNHWTTTTAATWIARKVLRYFYRLKKNVHFQIVYTNDIAVPYKLCSFCCVFFFLVFFLI